MNPKDFTEEQLKDIAERIDKARTMLSELQLRPSASVSVENIGDDVFATKVVPYLHDTKFAPTISPIQKDEV
jgi:hypothetical protein